MAPSEGLSERALAAAFQDEWGRIVAALIHQFGDWDLAEECAQEAFAMAADRWRNDGVPTRPGAWLLTVARNRAIDRLRRSSTFQAKLEELATTAMTETGKEGAPQEPSEDGPSPDQSGVTDERLRLIFTCCHPALAMEARVALTLRSLAGLSTAEIARAFLVPEATMAKRLVRAKQKIQTAGIPYRVPASGALAERADGVLAVLYLLFNEGYSASAGEDLVRRNLCDRAVGLAKVTAELMPGMPEARGLLALMLFHRARQAARMDEKGELVRLEDQDRSLWDMAQVQEGAHYLAEARERATAGPYQLQAEIAFCHASAPSAGATDWRTILRCYEQLAEMTGSPVVELNRAVAVAKVDGPEKALALVDELARTGALPGYYLLAATRADLLFRLGHRSEAATAYREALALVPTGPERRFLEARLEEAEPAWRSGPPVSRASRS